MKYLQIIYLITIFLFTYSGSFYDDFSIETNNTKILSENLYNIYKEDKIKEFGSNINGVLNRINTTEKIIALTFDACGGKNGNGVDEKLINFLINNNIKATFFVNIRWIVKNKNIFSKIINNQLFDIENHGLEHRPLLINKKEIYGINSTGSIKNVVKEIELSGLIIEKLTGRKPVYFRSGTAYYDDVSIKIANNLGYKIAGFTISADYGATLSAEKIKNNLLKAKNGDIILSHINRPKSDISKGFIEAIPILINNGYSFVKLSEVDLIR